MARPQKKGLDYFPKDVDFCSDRKVRKLKRKHGLLSLPVYDYLLSMIYKEKGYFIEYDEDICFDVYDVLGEDISESFVYDVIQSCLEINLFDKDLFAQYGVLTSKGIQRRYLNIKRRAKISDKYNLIDESENEKDQKSSQQSNESSNKKFETAPVKKDQEPEKVNDAPADESITEKERLEYLKSVKNNNVYPQVDKFETTAISFLRQNQNIQLEKFFKTDENYNTIEKYKQQSKFLKFYNNRVLELNINFEPAPLLAKLRNMASTWADNINKNSEKNQSGTKQTTGIPTITKAKSKTHEQ